MLCATTQDAANPAKLSFTGAGIGGLVGIFVNTAFLVGRLVEAGRSTGLFVGLRVGVDDLTGRSVGAGIIRLETGGFTPAAPPDTISVLVPKGMKSGDSTAFTVE